MTAAVREKLLEAAAALAEACRLLAGEIEPDAPTTAGRPAKRRRGRLARPAASVDEVTLARAREILERRGMV